MDPTYGFRDRVVTGVGSAMGLATARAVRRVRGRRRVRRPQRADPSDRDGGAYLHGPSGGSASRFPSMAATPPAEPRSRRTMITTSPFDIWQSLRPRRRYLLALLAVVSLSACGGDDEDDGATGNPGSR